MAVSLNLALFANFSTFLPLALRMVVTRRQESVLFHPTTILQTCSKLAFKERVLEIYSAIVEVIIVRRKFVTRTTISYYFQRGRGGLKDKIYSFFHKLGRYPAEGGEQRERAQHCLFTFSLLFFEISPPPSASFRASSHIHDIFPSHCYFKSFLLFPSHLFAARNRRARAHRWTKIRAEEWRKSMGRGDSE